MSLPRFLAFGLAIALLGATPNYAATPQEAAQLVFHSPGPSLTLTGRPNVVGKFAVVPITQGVLAGSSVAGHSMLLKRFSFGWQALALIDDSCALSRENIPPHDLSALLLGMPKVKAASAADCAPDIALGDRGPIRDVESIRQMMGLSFVPGVVVVGSFAVGNWYGEGGGQNLYYKSSGAWTLLSGGGSELSAAELRAKAVPPSDVCKFPVSDCPRK